MVFKNIFFYLGFSGARAKPIIRLGGPRNSLPDGPIDGLKAWKRTCLVPWPFCSRNSCQGQATASHFSSFASNKNMPKDAQCNLAPEALIWPNYKAQNDLNDKTLNSSRNDLIYGNLSWKLVPPAPNCAARLFCFFNSQGFPKKIDFGVNLRFAAK